MRERTTERSAACATCGKTFARSDTLLRHEKSHLATEDRGPVHRVTNGTFRACSSCAQARSRCSGGSPCGRCKVRSLDCSYPVKRRKVSTVPESVMVLNEKPAETDHNSTTSSQNATLRQPTTQFQEVVFQQAPSGSFTGEQHTETHAIRLNNQFTDMESTKDASHPNRHHLPHDYAVNPNQPTPGLQQGSQTQLPDPRSGPSHQGFPNEQYGTSYPQNYQPDLQMQAGPYGFDATFDESTSLNWIPLSVYPSPFGDLEQDFSFLLPPFSDSASLGTSYDATQFDRNLQGTLDGVNQQSLTPELRHTASVSLLGRSPASSNSDGFSHVRPLHRDGSSFEARRKRRKSSHAQEAFTKPSSTSKSYGFPDTSQFYPDETGRLLCDEAQYWSISMAFHELCTATATGKMFTSNNFPRFALVNHFIDLYFEHLQHTFPLIHQPTFGPNTPWITMLAVAAIGSNFSSLPASIEVREAFAEFLRRAIAAALGDEQDVARNDGLAQARILHLVNVAQSDRAIVRSTVPKYHAELSRWCLESGLLQLAAADDTTSQQATPEEKSTKWQRWVQQESARRIAYLIWYLDCCFGYLCNTRPLCNMDDARAPLPCAEFLWEASSAEEWYDLKKTTATTPSLCLALEQMYNTKRVPPGLSDISHVLLIHSLYSRTWEVGTHIKQPLSEWKSTGNARGFLNTPTKDNFWLPLYPLYANWRNSACDCLDVLHWHATGVIAKASGVEHHAVLQLHLARIILLTPFQEIQDLLFFLIGQEVGENSKATFYVHDGSYQRRDPSKLAQIRKITWRWLREDQHKARLAMIHAGNVFWHVRRYSSKSFLEPLAIYLATIVLWTYGSYKSAALEREAADAAGSRHDSSDSQEQQNSNVQPTRVEIAAHGYGSSKASATSRSSQQASPVEQQEPRSEGKQSTTEEDDEDDEEDQPEFIHLDRPCDDEIVQHFVRNGHNMAGYMSNVGDICTAPKKVLLEGAKLLRGKSGCWGVSRNYYDILCKVSELRKTAKDDQLRSK